MKAIPMLSRAAWLRLWRFLRRWNRYECVGFDRLVDNPGSLIVGYHGRGVAWDLFMLTTLVEEKLGYLPRGVAHDSTFALPVVRDIARALSLVSRRGGHLQRAVERGEHVLVSPGGTRESLRPWCRAYEVNWGPSRGFARLAVELQIPVIPVGAAGVDDLLIGLFDGHRAGELLGLRGKVAGPWLGLGLGGFFPFAMPFPVRIRQHIGPPLKDHIGAGRGPEVVEQLFADTRAAVQTQIDEARVAAPAPRPGQLVFAEYGP
jgi:hypothetical protein